MRFALALLIACGCGGSIATADGGASADATATDALPTDATTTVDAGTTVDTGTTVDAGTTSVYSAVAQPGGLDHLFIQKKDVTSNVCFKIHLVHPSAAVNPTFKVPAPWGPAQATAIPDAKACDGPSPVSAVYAASSIVGSVTFTPAPSPQQPYPKLVTIQATLTFTNPIAPIPPSETFTATDVPVTGI
jgi:hypothetical protein